MIDTILEWVAGASADDESDSARNGLLSYANEWHSLIIGLGIGAATTLASMPSLAVGGIALALGLTGVQKLGLSSRKAVREFTSEPWYGVGGILLTGWPELLAAWPVG